MAVTWKKVAFAMDAIAKTTLTTKGDMLRGTGSGTLERVGIGSATNVFKLATGIPGWGAAPSVGAHAASHHTGEADDLALSDLEAEGNVAFAGNQAVALVVQNKAGIPTTPVVGKWYYETTTDPGLYICTVSA